MKFDDLKFSLRGEGIQKIDSGFFLLQGLRHILNLYGTRKNFHSKLEGIPFGFYVLEILDGKKFVEKLAKSIAIESSSIGKMSLEDFLNSGDFETSEIFEIIYRVILWIENTVENLEIRPRLMNEESK
ncbi:MAG: hypothetical protein ACRCYP_07205, partial [Alphaproteobacteria bacterium]